MPCCGICLPKDDFDVKDIYEPAPNDPRPLANPINHDAIYRSPSPITETGSVVSHQRSRGGSIRDDVSALGTISIYSCSEYERNVRGEVGYGSSSLLPTWMNDKEADRCWICSCIFHSKSFWSGAFIPVSSRSSPGDKKHHCRRCRNIVCETCSQKRAIILLARGINIDGPDGPNPIYSDPNKLARVCDTCFAEIPEENEFLQLQRPALLQGETFTQRGAFLGFFSQLSRLSLTTDEFSLLVQTAKDQRAFANGTDQRETLALGEIDDIRTNKLLRLELVFANGKVMELEAASAVVHMWEAALKVAIRRAKQGSLKNRIELERRKRIEATRRGEEEERKKEAMTQKREAAKQERDAIRKKYVK